MVERYVRDVEAAGSNPVTSTNKNTGTPDTIGVPVFLFCLSPDLSLRQRGCRRFKSCRRIEKEFSFPKLIIVLY